MLLSMAKRRSYVVKIVQRGPRFTSMKTKRINSKSYRLSAVHLNGFTQTRLRFRSPLHLLHDPLNMIPRDAVEKHGCWTQCATAFFRLAPHNFHIQLSGSLKHPKGSAPTNSHKCNQYLKNRADGLWWRKREESGRQGPVQFSNVCVGRRGKKYSPDDIRQIRRLDRMFTRQKFENVRFQIVPISYWGSECMKVRFGTVCVRDPVSYLWREQTPAQLG